MEKKICFLVFTFLGIVGLQAKASIPAIFIFGDSTVDVGTNNYLIGSLALANFPYNGIDYPNSVPTGRFSNGYNTADLVARLMGFKESPPPFLSLLNDTSKFRNTIIHGVNFASAGAGILDETGRDTWKNIISLREQIEQFGTVRGNMTEIMGPEATASMLSKSLFLISIGSNDIFDHQRSNSSLSILHLMTALQSAYLNHLLNLYNLGAQKFGIISVPPIGCCPNERALNETGGCMEELNEFARAFHVTTERLLQIFSLSKIQYSLGNAYEMTTAIMEKARDFGYKEIKTACCGKGKFNGEIPCYQPFGPNLCQNRKEYLFWDLYHPTQGASKLAAQTLYGGGPRFVKPVNFSRLVEVDV